MQHNMIILDCFDYGNVGYKPVVDLIYHNYSFFKCAADQMYLTAGNTVSNTAPFSSPIDGAQIISNNYLLNTSAFW